MDCFCNVGGFDFVEVFEISDRAADFQNAIVGPCGETQTRHSTFQHRLAFGVGATVTTDQTRRHRRSREDSLGGESLALPFARFDNVIAVQYLISIVRGVPSSETETVLAVAVGLIRNTNFRAPGL